MILLAATLTEMLHAVLMLVAAPLLVGLIRLVRARLVGRRGPALHQPFRDLTRQLRRRPVVAENASALFVAAPVVYAVAIGGAALMVPSFAGGMVLAPLSDLLVIGGLLGLARVTLGLAALDVGTAFGGVGASRFMAFGVFGEPALLLVTLVLTMLAGSTNLDVVTAVLRDGSIGIRVSLGLAMLAMLVQALADTGRLPVGNPATHLELAMLEEASLLEYSGWHLAVMEGAQALKLLLWLDLIAAIFLPFGMAPGGAGPLAWAAGLLAWLVKIALLGSALAVFETAIARMRIFRVPEFLAVGVLLGLVAAVFLFFSQGFA